MLYGIDTYINSTILLFQWLLLFSYLQLNSVLRTGFHISKGELQSGLPYLMYQNTNLLTLSRSLSAANTTATWSTTEANAESSDGRRYSTNHVPQATISHLCSINIYIPRDNTSTPTTSHKNLESAFYRHQMLFALRYNLSLILQHDDYCRAGTMFFVSRRWIVSQCTTQKH